jgi:serine/threonine-protein kinase
MEYVNGQSLQELIARHGPAEYADAVEYIRQAAEGLEHAHRAGLVHRDIKPANLLLDSTGTVKILDMGLARFFDDRDENPLTVAHDEKVLGTADYLAPEQAMDSHSVDTRADIYSLGCSLYFLLTGHPPFTEGTLAQRLMWHQMKPFPPITDARLDCPASLVAILNKMVEKKPEDRFQSAAEVAAACRQWLAENAGEDWKLRHPPPSRPGGAGARSGAPPRDIQSDSVMGVTASHVMSPLPAGARFDVDSAAPTKISSTPGSPSEESGAPTTVSTSSSAASTTTTPTVKPPTATPVATPVAVPVVATPVAPIAQPVVPKPPPTALPVAWPPATPVAAPSPPVAQPVKPTTPIAASVVPPTASPAAPTKPTHSAPPDEIAQPAALDADEADQTLIANAAVDEPETAPAGDLFSLFVGATDTVAQEAPAEAVPASAEPEVASTAAFVPEAITADVADRETTETIGFDFVDDQPAVAEPSQKPTKKTASSPFTADWQKHLKNPQVRIAGFAVAVVLVIGVVWWSLKQPATKNAEKAAKNAGKNVAKESGTGTKSSVTSTSTAKKSNAHEVTLHVGPGGEFRSISRAVHSIVEGRKEHEAAAAGKPLRFIIVGKAGQTFEESIVLDESLGGEVHLRSDSPGRSLKLVPPENEPAISIRNLDAVRIEDVFIDLTGFPAKERGIVIRDACPQCLIRKCTISGAGQSGIELDAAAGGESGGSIRLESITFQNASPTAAGIQIVKPSGQGTTRNVTVDRCRFVSSMSAAVLVAGNVESLTVRQCGVSGAQCGVRIAGGVAIKDVLIDHCSFLNLSEAGVWFDAMPAAGSANFALRNCLFSAVKKAELLVAKNYDQKQFDAMISSPQALENNWSDRAAKSPTPGERDVLDATSSRVPAIQFAATTSNSELFLVAKPTEPYKNAGVTPE